MTSIVEIDDAILEALRGSKAYSIQGRSGSYTAVKNPWQGPIQLQKAGVTIASLMNEDDWLVAPSGFFGTPKLDSYTAQQWAMISRPFEAPASSLDWRNMPAATSPSAGAAVPSPYVATPYNAQPTSPPGQVMAIIGLILALIAPVVGIFFSIIALAKAPKGVPSSTKTMGTIGTILNGFFILIGAFIWGFFLIGSVSPFNSAFDSTYSSEDDGAIPAWWDEELVSILTAVNEIQGPFVDEYITDDCSFSYIDNAYTAQTNVTEGQLSDIASQYQEKLELLYPNADISVTSLSNFDNTRYYRVDAESVFDDNFNYATPSVTVTIYQESSELSISSFCE